MISRFCMTIIWSAFILCAMLTAIMQFATALLSDLLSVTLYDSGTRSEFTYILHILCIVSNCAGSKRLIAMFCGCAANTGVFILLVFNCQFFMFR